MESINVLSQVSVHVRVRRSSSHPVDVTVKVDFIGSGEAKSWRQQELRGRVKEKKGCPVFLVILILLLFSRFFQNTFSLLCSVESERELRREVSALSPTFTVAFIYTPIKKRQQTH